MIPIERNTDVRIKCYQCGGEFTMDQMRMGPTGKNLVCKNCLERKSPSTARPADGSPLKAASQQPSSGKKASDKASYFCKACRYSFTRAPHIEVSDCPYCGQSGTITKKSSATSLVHKVEEMAGDGE